MKMASSAVLFALMLPTAVDSAMLKSRLRASSLKEADKDGFPLHAKHVVNQTIPLGEGGFSFHVTKCGDQATYPKKGDKLKMHYVGKLKDGTVFDSSRERGEPFEFTIGTGKVIRGWDQGVLEMSLGERGILHVPSYKGYGDHGAGDGAIPPNADLDFDVELLGINGQEVPQLVKSESGVVRFHNNASLLSSAGRFPLHQKHVVNQTIKLGEGGFSFRVSKPGDGATYPKKGDKLKMHYIGKLMNGKIFDSSRERGEPFEFTIGAGKVIRGWDQGVLEMSLGERGILHVPSYKGYGDRGTGDGAIPPNSDLDFDVELLGINGQEVSNLIKSESNVVRFHAGNGTSSM